MIDLYAVNQAIYATLQQVAPPNCKYILVLWGEDDDRICIGSNETSERAVHRMLSSAAEIVATKKGHFIPIDEPAGQA